MFFWKEFSSQVLSVIGFWQTLSQFRCCLHCERTTIVDSAIYIEGQVLNPESENFEKIEGNRVSVTDYVSRHEFKFALHSDNTH